MISAIDRPEDACGPASRPDPDVLAPLYSDTSSTGCKPALVRERRRDVSRRNLLPGGSAIVGPDDQEMPIDRVAEGYTAIGIPESHGIEECFRVLVGELQLPIFPAIRRLIDS